MTRTRPATARTPRRPTRCSSAFSPGAARRGGRRSPTTGRRPSWPRPPTVGLGDQRATYVAGRATLCSTPDDLARYDQVYAAFFDARDGLPRERPAAPSTPTYTDADRRRRDRHREGDESTDDVVRAMASEVEVLRHRDVASMTPAEKHRLVDAVRDPAPAPAAAAHPAPGVVAPRPGRRPGDAAREPAAARRAGADPVPAPPHAAPARRAAHRRLRLDERVRRRAAASRAHDDP